MCNEEGGLQGFVPIGVAYGGYKYIVLQALQLNLRNSNLGFPKSDSNQKPNPRDSPYSNPNLTLMS